MRREVGFLVEQEGEAVRPAIERVVRRGRAALPAIESALHTAPPRGRRNLIDALGALGDREAAPLLRHFARFDDDESVRAAAARTLAALH